MGHDEHELEAVNLIFDPKRVRVAGETLEGEVDLYFPKLMEDKIEEVHVKLRGAIVTKITRSIPGPPGQAPRYIHHTQRVDLIREDLSLWRPGSAYPQPDTHILKLPFRFVLPASLPPSYQHEGFQWEGTVGYALEAVGVRSGLHFNRRILLSFPLLPADIQGAQLRAALSTGWTGAWRAIEKKDEIRRGIWGEYSHVQVTIVLPEVPAFPVLTPIPFTVNIVTISKTMKQDDEDEGDTIFPAPPTQAQDVHFKLLSDIHVKAGIHDSSSNDNAITYLGGLGPDLPAQLYEAVRVEPVGKIWIPSQDPHDAKHHKGQWRQEVNLKSFFSLSCAPTFETQTMSLKYHAHMKIDFPGIGNDLKLDFPVQLISCMPPPGQQFSAVPVPPLDLPPAYYDSPGTWNDADTKEG